MHVDFDCIFLKGLTFTVPETVPFRLTHNMVDAMGVTGYEGVFRHMCETTMRVLRRERDSLVTVLNSFLHDPVVEWDHYAGGKRRGGAATAPLDSASRARVPAGATRNRMAARIIRSVNDRLQGAIDDYSLFPGPTTSSDAATFLSVPGQVDALLKAATDLENLSKLYIGWMAAI